jgi:hypothetical protein
MGRKKGRLNANISLYLAIKYTTEVYIYVLIMLEISLITVIYKRMGKFWYITQSELNSCKWRYFH